MPFGAPVDELAEGEPEGPPRGPLSTAQEQGGTEARTLEEGLRVFVLRQISTLPSRDEREATVDALLVVGVASALVFLLVVFVEGARRPGYDPAYHMVSALSSGNRGWVQIANFLQFGLGMVAFAIGVSQALDTVVGPVLLALFGMGAMVSGLFSMDPAMGYPPGTPPGMPTETSSRHQIHGAAGPVMFIAIFGACLSLAGRLDSGWRVYTVITAVVGLVSTVSTIVAAQRDATKTGLIQRGLIVVYWVWIVLLGVHLI